MTEANNSTPNVRGDEESGPRPENPSQSWTLDPRWFVSQANSGREMSPALNMLNDLIRVPYNFRRSNSESAENRGLNQATDSVSANYPSSSNSRTRLASALHRGSVNNPVEQSSGNTSPTSPISNSMPSMASAVRGFLQSASARARLSHAGPEIPPLPEGIHRSNSESYVVEMESETSWVPPHASQQTASVHNVPQENQEARTPDDDRARSTPLGSNASGGNSPGSQDQGTTTPAEIFRQSPEGQAIISVVERYSPFLVILLIKGLFDHGSGIVCFLALLLTFSHANSLFKKEVSKQSKRKLTYLLMIAANLLVCMGFIFYVYSDEKLYLGLMFLPTETTIMSMWTMFWVTGVVDFIAKFITIIVKILVLICPARMCPYQKRGKYYLFVERTSQLYRTSIPMYAWVQYMSDTYEGPAAIVGCILVMLYCVLKISDIVKRYKAWRTAFIKMLQQVHYGTTPTESELKEAGEVCPICHDVFQDPTKLNCSHIFCEECVTTWFDRERTCPMCRARVVDDPSYRDGQTTHFIQIF